MKVGTLPNPKPKNWLIFFWVKPHTDPTKRKEWLLLIKKNRRFIAKYIFLDIIGFAKFRFYFSTTRTYQQF